MAASKSQKSEAVFAIRLKRDGTLEGMPVPEGAPATPYLRVYQESALRAIIECQPYKLPAAFFEEWKYFAPVFTRKRSERARPLAIANWQSQKSKIEAMTDKNGLPKCRFA